MRVEHLPFLKLGSSVCTAATCFDELGQIPYSRERFGDDWETAVMVGRVRRKHKSYVMVCWDDNIVRQASFEDIELHGNDLLAAENRLKHRATATLPNIVGGSTRKSSNIPENSSRLTTSNSDTNSDSDAPLNRLRPQAPTREDSVDNPSTDSSIEEGTSSPTSSEDFHV